MRVEIFDVGHGQCAVITAPNGRRMMIDCGDRWGEETFWTPSLHYFRETIDLLALTNLDEDHLSDFKGMIEDCKVPWILTNPSIGAREFAILKQDGMGSGAKALAAWLARPRGLPGAQPDFGPVQIRWYSWSFVPGIVNKTNDLSLAVVVQFGAFKIVFTGDLEVAGWRRLLTIPEFRADLLGTTVFVASHHGRESGCCTELFDLIRPQPQLVIISDNEHQHDSQDTNAWYRSRCTGAIFASNPVERRYVATTRKDGSMMLDIDAAGRWTIQRVKVRDWQRKPATPAPVPAFSALSALLSSGQNSFGSGLASFAPGSGVDGFGFLNTQDDSLARALGLGALSPFLTKR